MPGITGIICKSVVGNEEQKVKLMVDCMRHEDFYSHGTYANPDLGIFAGHLSLGGCPRIIIKLLFQAISVRNFYKFNYEKSFISL